MAGIESPFSNYRLWFELIFRFLDFELDEERFEIRRGQRPVHTQRRAFDFLRYLLLNRDRVVSHDELIETLWDGAARSESNIPQCVASIRRSMGEQVDRDAVIQTVRGRGYRFVAEIEEIAPARNSADAPPRVDPIQADSSSSPFVGRREVMATLRSALGESLSGETRVVMLVGEPGIGKTRAVEELAREAADRGATVLTGRCYKGEGAPAFWPWLQIADEWVGLHTTSMLPVEFKALAKARRRWFSEKSPRTPAIGMEAVEARFQLFDAGARALQRGAQYAPLVLVLEDIHWADPASLGLLRFAAEQIHHVPLLMLGTYRGNELDSTPELSLTLGELSRESTFRRIPVEGLGAEHVNELLSQIVSKDIPTALFESVASMTEGNPFFVIELARILDAAESAPESGDPGGRGSIGLPASVSDAIAFRLGRLTDGSRQLLTLAAVIGREFGVTLLSEVAGQECELILQLLEEAALLGIVEPVRNAPDTYRFNHALTREALYQRVEATSRAPLHGSVAKTLERLHANSMAPPLAALAYHWYEALETGELEKAAEYCRRAGVWALSKLAFEEAAHQLKRALELADLRPSSGESESCELLLHLGQAQWSVGERAEAQATYAKVVALARRIGSAEYLARAAIGNFGFEQGHTEDATARALLEEAAAVLDDDLPALRAQVLTKLVFMAPYADLMETRQSMSLEALELARNCGDVRALREAFHARLWATPTPMFLEQRRVWTKECLAWGEQLDDPWLSWLGTDSVLAFSLGDRAELVRAMQESSHFAGLSGHRSGQFVILLEQTGFALLEGRFDDSTRFIGQILEAGKDCTSWAPESYYAYLFLEGWQRGILHQPGQDWPTFFEGLIAGLPGRETIGHAAIALLKAFGEDRKGALAELDWLTGSIGPEFREVPQNENWLSAMYLMSEVIERLDAQPYAELLAPALEPFVDQMVCHPSHRLPGGSIATMLGLLSSVLGDFEAGEAYFEEGYAREKAFGARPVMLRSRAGLACLLLRRGARGDRSRADALMEEVLSGCEDLGIHPDVKYVEPFERLLQR
ncbi:MAG: AAA family ATPase [bacterium]|nr:AAA family ATPase [bacterium]